MDQNKFIDELVTDLKPSRYWLPGVRTLVWLALAFLFNLIVMILVQAFRPQFFADLAYYPRFLFEIVSGFTLSGFLVYRILNQVVPGLSISKWISFIGFLTGGIWVTSLSLSFFTESPPVRLLGARPHCLEEVGIYGALGLLSFYYFLRKGDYQLSRTHYLMIGVAAGLVPATLMQMACMYSPWHSLVHYGPILILSILGLLLSRRVEQTKKSIR